MVHVGYSQKLRNNGRKFSKTVGSASFWDSSANFWNLSINFWDSCSEVFRTNRRKKYGKQKPFVCSRNFERERKEDLGRQQDRFLRLCLPPPFAFQMALLL